MLLCRSIDSMHFDDLLPKTNLTMKAQGTILKRMSSAIAREKRFLTCAQMFQISFDSAAKLSSESI